MSAWKGTALTLIFIMLAVLLFNLFKPVPSNTNDANDAITKQYSEYMTEAEKKNDAYYKKVEESVRKASSINDLSLRNQERFAKILTRWEQQADRMDKVLSRLEKNKQ